VVLGVVVRVPVTVEVAVTVGLGCGVTVALVVAVALGVGLAVAVPSGILATNDSLSPNVSVKYADVRETPATAKSRPNAARNNARLMAPLLRANRASS
jgi:hypothetical protein